MKEYFFKLLYLQITLASINFYDELPFIEHQQIVLKQNQKNEHSISINFKNKFINPPIILIGLTKYENIQNAKQIEFNIIAKDITETQYSLQVVEPPNSPLQGIGVDILAIDTNYLLNVSIKQVEINNIQFQKVDEQSQIEFFAYNMNYSFKNIKNGEERKLAALITGFCGEYNNQQTFSLSVKIDKKQDHFNVIIYKNKNSVDITKVYVNILEVIEETNSFYGINIIDNLKYDDSKENPCFIKYDNTCLGKEEDQKERFINQKMSLSQTIESKTKVTETYNKLFIGLTKLDIQYTQQSNNTSHIQLTNYKYSQIDKTLSFDYRIWENTQVLGITTSAIHFYMKKCIDADQYFYQNQCITKCDTSIISFSQQAKICLNCDSSCQTCSQSSLKKCLSCKQDFFYLKEQQQCVFEVISITQEKLYCNLLEKACYYCPINKNCSECNPQNLQNVKDSLACTKCPDSHKYLFEGICYSETPTNSYCNEENICQRCKQSACKICKQDLNTCQECFNNPQLIQNSDIGTCSCLLQNHYFSLNEMICIPCSNMCLECENEAHFCTKCGQYSKLIEKTKSCECIDQNFAFDESRNCQGCLSINMKKVLEPNLKISICECVNSSHYFNFQKKDCLTCPFFKCQKCSSDGETCQECQSGLIFRDQNRKLGCKYCGEGTYNKIQEYIPGSTSLQTEGICKEKCTDSCVICKDSEICQMYSSEHSFKGDECHISCSECSGKEKYECIKCSSETRTLQLWDKWCPCKEGYQDVGDADCVKIKQNDMKQLTGKYATIAHAKSIIIKLCFVLIIPQIIFNFHPFGDTLGNIDFLSKKQMIYSSFTMFNYFNLQLNSQSKNEIYDVCRFHQFLCEDNFLSLRFKTYVDDQFVQAFLFPLVSFLICLIAVLIVYILNNQYQLYNQRIYFHFIWNHFLKIVRISSNYVFLCIFADLSRYRNQSIPSLSVFALTVLVIFFYIYLIFRRDTNKVEEQYKYLFQGLKQNTRYCRNFWIFQELKKIILVILLYNIKLQQYCIVATSLCFLQAIIYFIYRPSSENLKDSIYLVINELLIGSLHIFPLFVNFQTEWNEESDRFIQYIANIISITVGILILIIIFEFILRLIIQYKKQKKQQEQEIEKFLSNPIQIDMTTAFKMQDLEQFLNQSNWNKNPLITHSKRQKSTETEEKSPTKVKESKSFFKQQKQLLQKI